MAQELMFKMERMVCLEEPMDMEVEIIAGIQIGQDLPLTLTFIILSGTMEQYGMMPITT